MAMTSPATSPDQPEPADVPYYQPPAPISYMPGATTPVSPAPGYGPPYAPQPYPYQGPPAVAAGSPKRSRRGLILGLVALAVLVIAGLATATVVAVSHAKQNATGSSSTYKPIYDNGAAPVAPVTTAPRYPDPTATDFQLTPKITQKHCFGSAGCNVTFTVDLAYGGSGAKPNSTWNITYDVAGTEDAMTNTISLHFDDTGIHGKYDSTEEMVRTKNSSDVLTLKITAISPGFGN